MAKRNECLICKKKVSFGRSYKTNFPKTMRCKLLHIRINNISPYEYIDKDGNKCISKHPQNTQLKRAYSYISLCEDCYRIYYKTIEAILRNTFEEIRVRMKNMEEKILNLPDSVRQAMSEMLN